MNEIERQEFVYKEIAVVCEEMDNPINQLVLLKRFLQKAVAVLNGAEPDYDNLFKIINDRIK